MTTAPPAQIPAATGVLRVFSGTALAPRPRSQSPQIASSAHPATMAAPARRVMVGRVASLATPTVRRPTQTAASVAPTDFLERACATAATATCHRAAIRASRRPIRPWCRRLRASLLGRHCRLRLPRCTHRDQARRPHRSRRPHRGRLWLRGARVEVLCRCRRRRPRLLLLLRRRRSWRAAAGRCCRASL